MPISALAFIKSSCFPMSKPIIYNRKSYDFMTFFIMLFNEISNIKNAPPLEFFRAFPF
jgi:hypothetical protein